MLQSEDQAKGKWCPFTRVGVHSGTGAVSVNRYPLAATIHEETRCLARGCMAWRWAGWQTTFETVAPLPPEDIRIGERLGYCGLAGEVVTRRGDDA